MPTNGSYLLINILILFLISSKLYIIKSLIHCDSDHFKRDTKYILGLKAISYNGRNAYWDIIPQWAEEWWLHASSPRELRCKEVWTVMLGFNCWELQAHHTLTVNCTLGTYLVRMHASKILPLWTALLIEISSHDRFSDMSDGGLMIHFDSIQLGLCAKYTGHWDLWVSMVHRWVGVGGHLVELLSTITDMQLKMSSCCSFDRSRCCCSNLKIWNCTSEHTT